MNTEGHYIKKKYSIRFLNRYSYMPSFKILIISYILNTKISVK